MSAFPDRVVSTICPFCGVGCGMGLRVSDAQVVGVEPLRSHPVSRGQLCVKGYASAYAIDPADRIRTPLIKERGGFRAASWDEALDVVAEGFVAAQRRLGRDGVGVISCARATNEDNYATQKLARAALGTNNVDHCARICHSPSVAGLRQTLGASAMTNGISDLTHSDLVVAIGCDTTESHTILGAWMTRAKLGGAKLLVIDPRRTRLARMADLHLPLRPGTNIALLNGMLHVIFARGLEDREYLAAHVDHVEALKVKVAEYPPERVAQITGVAAADVIAAAELYAGARAAFLAYGMGITQHATGTANVIAVSNLVLACGQVGRAGTGINPLRGQNNVQGACDMGALPDVYPGYQPVSSAEANTKFSRAWGRALSSQPGLTSLGMQQAAREGTLAAMMILGEDPVVTDPDQTAVARALRALDLLVVVELTMTETAKLADVILPAASFAEKDGTFTSCERRVQRVRAAVPPPGEAKPDSVMLGELARRLGYDGMSYESAEAIFDELASLMPIYSAMSYARLEAAHGLCWPCDSAHPEGTPRLHEHGFPIGRARMVPVDHHGPAEAPDAAFPLILTTNRLGFHYGCGSMTRKSPLLERETPRGLLYIHPRDAARLHLVQGSAVHVSSRRGQVDTAAVVSDEVPEGLVAMPYHFREAPCNALTNDAQDPVTHMPELKVCAVRVEARADPTTTPQQALLVEAAGDTGAKP